LQINTNALPNAQRGRFYNQNLQATGGSGSYTWTVSAGTLPNGLWLDSATGKIRGKAAVRGVWNFTINVQDSQNQSASAMQNFTINVRLYSGF
jgi:hypothetical protein